jgi:hypothetical protein
VQSNCPNLPFDFYKKMTELINFTQMCWNSTSIIFMRYWILCLVAAASWGLLLTFILWYQPWVTDSGIQQNVENQDVLDLKQKCEIYTEE